MRGRGLNACSVVIKKYRTVCCSVKTNKGRLARAAGGCGGFGVARAVADAWVCTRVSENRGRVLAKTNPRRRKSGGSLRRRRAGRAGLWRSGKEGICKGRPPPPPPSFLRPSPGVRRSPSASLRRPRGRPLAGHALFFPFLRDEESPSKHSARHAKSTDNVSIITNLKTGKGNA